MTEEIKYIAKKIHIRGLVQGVGFRPFVYRLAHDHGIRGWVENRNDGVVIHAEGASKAVQNFIVEIRQKAPLASNIQQMDLEDQKAENFDDFVIIRSENASDHITDVSPDIAVCDECLTDMKRQPHRLDYPFINCTNCGPRFSIIRGLPYDRAETTMEPFRMCTTCLREYQNVFDRRFHAQPVACSVCGPHYELYCRDEVSKDFRTILKTTAELLRRGEIVAVKGIGGFQIVCDASNQEAVKKLRSKKVREGKPFAVMFSSVEVVEEYTYLSPQEKASLTSWRRPILILKQKKSLAPGVSAGFKTIGSMLPYMPFHHLLFEYLDKPAIVFTSGNISDEPIVIDNAQAINSLSRIADAILVYDREIYNRTDDSVVLVVNETERIIRRSRGYSPEPVNLDLDVDGIVAAGAELVNCFCVGKGKQAILSQHIGDLKNLETLEFYEESYRRFLKLFRVNPSLFIHDLHPDYLSTRFAKESGIPSLAVQHHHAHVVSCLAENILDEAVIGVSMDGTGYGDDGCIWGGEFFICDRADYQRVSHFDYVPLPGGDQVTREPWRTGISYLYKVFGKHYSELKIPFVAMLDQHKANLMIEMIEKKLNSPLCSSAGRLFDAVAAITGVCTHSLFHAEAPMRLENVMDKEIKTSYPVSIGQVVSFDPAIRQMVEDLTTGIPVADISAKFHNCFIDAISAQVKEISDQSGLTKVVLSGGTFQNRYVLARLEKKLGDQGFKVFTHSRIPSNDGGIALGQLVIAAKKRELGKC